MGRACLWQQNINQRTTTTTPSFVCLSISAAEMMMMGECVRSGSNSPQTTGNRFPASWRTSIPCLDDDDDDIAFSLWRVLLRKCINTLWYGWFTFFCFLLLLAIFFTFFYFFHTTYIEIFEAGETGQCGLFHFYMGFLMYISSVFVSVSALLSSVICFGRKALWSWRVYLEFRFPVHKKSNV